MNAERPARQRLEGREASRERFDTDDRTTGP